MTLLSPSLRPAQPSAGCRVRFGRECRVSAGDTGTPELAVAMPVLAGSNHEVLLAHAESVEVREGFQVFSHEGRISGFALADPATDLESATLALYARLLRVARGRQLCRVWNYVPHINAVEDGLENYQRFCRGRSIAFEQAWGTGFQRHLPAASGVGTAGGRLAVAFLAVETTPKHLENPRQVPAFEYPTQYGPRSPSFARATLTIDEAGAPQLFISGTAAIRGHATVAPGDLSRQLECTLENLGIIARAAGASLVPGSDWHHQFKVYLRHAADLGPARNRLRQEGWDDTSTYLHADLCRSDLLVEIEAVLTRR